jgi:hypothetical protein
MMGSSAPMSRLAMLTDTYSPQAAPLWAIAIPDICAELRDEPDE